MDYEENQKIFDSSKLEYSFKEGFLRWKKHNKLMEKKSRRSNHCFGHNRGCRASIEIRTRKKGRKINYESKFGYIDFYENILEDEPVKINKTRTTKWEFCFDLPEELVIEVLTKLPLKSFARFKCVSQHWQRLILNNVPMTNHPKLLIFSHTKNKPYDLLTKKERKKKPYSFCSLDNKTDVESVCSPRELEHELAYQMFEVHSSCQGLLLIQIHADLFVWNPLTNFFRKVLTLDLQIYEDDKTCIVVDLCYCSANDEYKVVLVVKSWLYSSSSWHKEDYYVATCGASNWKKIDVYLDDVFQGPFFKGYKHWINKSFKSYFHDPIPPRMHIVYFDPRTNKFIEVANPEPKNEDDNTFLSLGVYDECLCITRWDDPGNYQGNIELLVMKEYGNGNSWEVMLVFPNLPEFRSYGCFELLFKTKEGEILVSMYMGYRAECVKAFDVHGNFIRDIWPHTKDYSAYYRFCEVILYEESWFSPTGYSWGQN